MPKLLSPESSQLLIIDMQERLVPAMAEFQQLLKACRILAATASALKIPITLSEQYPKGLGPTRPEIAEAAVDCRAIAKTEFSILKSQALHQTVTSDADRKQLIVAGVEAHVCVLQSVMDALDLRFQVFVVEDAIASRKQESKAVALERISQAGGIIVTAEMVVFECLRSASSPHFKTLSTLLRYGHREPGNAGRLSSANAFER
jgi:isochorismate hydrolase